MTTLSIKSEAEAKRWQAEVQRLNEETEKLLKEVGTALQQVKDDADSTIVDELYDYGTRIVTGATQVFQGMTGLFNIVTDLCKSLNEVLDTGKNIVKGAIKGISSLLG